MRFLLDTNICSAHMRRQEGLYHRFVQYSGGLATTSINLGELYAWAYKQDDPALILAKIADLLEDVAVVDFDAECSEEFGKLRGMLLRTGVTVSPIDLMIAASALVRDMTMVTRNIKHFEAIPGLRLANWLE